ncbi:hypothetical protein ABH908_000270 [Pseudomonas frederiksbergensis]
MPLVLSACVGTSEPHSLRQAPVHVREVGPTTPKVVGEQVLLDPSSAVRDGRGVRFLALDGRQTLRVTLDCTSHNGRFTENGEMATFSLPFFPRLTKAALEACCELPMPEHLTTDQKLLVNQNPTQADYESAHTALFCGSFSRMSRGQQLALIENAKTDPGVRQKIEPCIRAMRARSH